MIRWKKSSVEQTREYVAYAIEKLKPYQRELFEERAAIMYFDGSLPLHLAERQALRSVRREYFQLSIFGDNL